MIAAISGGNSGGPVITEEGYAVGISSYGSTWPPAQLCPLHGLYHRFPRHHGIPYDKLPTAPRRSTRCGRRDRRRRRGRRRGARGPVRRRRPSHLGSHNHNSGRRSHCGRHTRPYPDIRKKLLLSSPSCSSSPYRRTPPPHSPQGATAA